MRCHPLVARPRLLLYALAALAAGCAGDEDRAESADFGAAVRHTIAVQTANPGAAGIGLDAVKAAAALKAYREDAGKRDALVPQLDTKVR